MAEPQEQQARPISPDEVELLKKQRDLVLPSARLAAYDDFSKWLFTTIAVVGTLAAAFSNAALKGLSRIGAGLFFAAIVLVGVSLALAVILRGVEPKDPNWQSLDQMLDRSKKAVLKKRKLAWWAGGLFATAIFLAALAPIFSLQQPQAPASHGLTLTFGPTGVRVLAKMGTDAKGFGLVRITVQTCKGEKLIGAQRLIDSANKGLEMDVTSSPIPTNAKTIKVYVSCAGQKADQESVFTFQMSPKLPDQPATTAESMCFR